MSRLYLLRHAKSSWDDPELSDRERPLATRGVRAARRLARYARRRGIAVDVVLCSPARRARQTLELVEASLAGRAEVRVEDGLYGASAEDLIARLRRLPDAVGSVLLVGHNPGLQDLTAMLAGTGPAARQPGQRFPTGALAALAVPEPWAALGPGRAKLVDLVVPRELG